MGHVGHDEARLWLRATEALPWEVFVSEAGSTLPPVKVEGPALNDQSYLSGIAILPGLKPNTRYQYQIVLGGREQLPLPLPTFITSPPPDSAEKLRIVFGSCVGRTNSAAAPSWGELAARRELDDDDGRFDVLLMLGDNHYGDTTNMDHLRLHYMTHRLSAGWRDLAAKTPIYAIWDDHDFGPNNSDGTEPGKDNSLRAFRDFWPNPACGEADNPGCYFTFTRGQVQFFMLDCRYHRSPDAMPDGPEKAMLGTKQIEWLKRELLASKATIKILATGSEWQTFGSNDAWNLYRHERDLLLKWIEENQLKGIILLSGDRHVSSGYQVMGRFVELSGGPFGSANAKLRSPNPERFTGYETGRLWGVLDIDTTSADPSVAYEFWQAGGGRLERRKLTWAQLHGQEKIGPLTTGKADI